jgi:hypothetical protein
MGSLHNKQAKKRLRDYVKPKQIRISGWFNRHQKVQLKRMNSYDYRQKSRTTSSHSLDRKSMVSQMQQKIQTASKMERSYKPVMTPLNAWKRLGHKHP